MNIPEIADSIEACWAEKAKIDAELKLFIQALDRLGVQWAGMAASKLEEQQEDICRLRHQLALARGRIESLQNMLSQVADENYELNSALAECRERGGASHD